MTKASATELQTKHRGGDADGPRSRPKDEHEDKQTKVLHDELDDSFPASDPPASTQPTGKEPPAPKPLKRD
jgi:hypothetical protein